jgi:UDP-N-acetylglucosamine 2-epimerase (non-hydrolysing)
MSKTIHLIAAARPNFMKIAPVYHALKKEAAWATPVIVHTGQHYDYSMSAAFFNDLGLPDPDFSLEIGSGTHAEQTAGVMIAYERLCSGTRPDWVVVVGDVNSTAACALVAKKLTLPLAHLEAGLRSRDRTMPEEINRLVTDAISDLLWTPSEDADENLRNEGVSSDRIVRVGNIMIDSYELVRPAIELVNVAADFGIEAGRYGIVTLHRPSNVDRREVLARLVNDLVEVARDIPLVFAVHPRTTARLEEFGLRATLAAARHIHLTEPMSYIRFMALVRGARFVITDSGGVQEETTYLDIPCLTLRDTTERPITLTQGSNRLVKPELLASAISQVMSGRWPHGTRPALWDGRTAGRVVESLKRASAA